MSEKNMIKTDVPGYYRDPKTNLIINTNDHEYERLKLVRRHTHEMNDLKSELKELKQLIINNLATR